jgi:hypothetical protein
MASGGRKAMNNSRASDEKMQAEERLSSERRRFLRTLATAVVAICSGLLFPRSARTLVTRPGNVSKDVGKKKALPLNAYPSFRKKCRKETYQYYHDASGTVKTLTKTICD